MEYAKTDMCRTIETYAKRKGFLKIRCYVVTLEDGVKEYAICDDTEWLYGSQSAEAIAVHIDMLKLAEKQT
jgi:hypothetical protein